MAKTSFAAQSHPELDAAPDASPTKPTEGTQSASSAVATRAESAVSSPVNSGGEVEGEISSKDIRLPRLNIVQKSGKLGDDFNAGSIVFDKELLLSKGDDAVNLTVLKIQKRYQEKLPFDPEGPQPKTFDTAEEVRREGGTTDFDVAESEGVPYYRSLANILILIEAPTTLTPDEKENYFPYEFEGKSYTVAMWTATGSAYTGAAKPIFSAKALRLKNGLHLGGWTLKTEKKSDARNTWFAPVLKPGNKHNEAFVEFVKGILG